jgi:hypothetical protein
MVDYLVVRVRGILRSIGILGSLVWSIPLIALSVSAQEKPRPTERPDTLRPYTPFRATVLSVDSTRLVLSAPTERGQRELHLSPALLRRLSEFRGKTFTAIAEERPTPAGLRGAVVLRDGNTLRVVAEGIYDVPVLRPVDRGGIDVRLAPVDKPVFVFQDQCKTVYDVARVFSIGDDSIVVRPYETRTVSTKQGSFTISMGVSQTVVPKDCPAVFEGSRQTIEYVITRKP